MTSSFPNNPSPRRRGFTITEVLVVVAIIVVLSSIGLVVGRRAFATADATRIRAQLQTLELGLEAYKSDFGSYPTTSLDQGTTSADDVINEAGYRGARLLCKALIAPTPQGVPGAAPSNYSERPNQDGADGPGFRIPPRSGVFKLDANNPGKFEGKVYGPYLSGGGLKYGKLAGGTSLMIDEGDKNLDDTTVLADANGNVILYFPVINTVPVMSNPDTYLGNGAGPVQPMYRFSDNDVLYANRDTSHAGTIAERLTILRAALTKAGTPKGKLLLISPGRDGLFGPNPSDKNKADDDVTNFARE